jgi:hypothetical protein
MADTKISALTASTTPLAGTEVLPIVQSGVTKQVSVANLTAGRAISTSSVTLAAGTVSAPVVTTTGDTNTGIYFPAADTLAFTIGGVEPGRFDSSGNFLLGATSSSSGVKMRINYSTGQNGMQLRDAANTNNSSFLIFQDGNDTIIGSVTRVGGTDAVIYNTTSDYRLKTVIGAVSGHGERIDALEPIEYTWTKNNYRTRGFLAHKFQEVYADSVNGTKDAVDAEGNPVYQAMQAGSTEVIADLVAEIQSLRKRVAALEVK